MTPRTRTRPRRAAPAAGRVTLEAVRTVQAYLEHHLGVNLRAPAASSTSYFAFLSSPSSSESGSPWTMDPLQQG